jgi:hypothetical protein
MPLLISIPPKRLRWLVVRNRNKAVVPEAAAVVSTNAPPVAGPAAVVQPSVPAPSVAPGVTKTPEPTKAAGSAPKAPKKEEKAAAVEKAASVPPPTPVAPAAPVAPASPARSLAVVDFDPKILNPKENSRLKIDAEHMPADLDFTVEMNGKIYFERSTAGNKPDYDDWFVPPGVQEFRVSAKSGKVQKDSNIVSAEFSAKKRKTLKVELRVEGKTSDAGMPQGLYPDSQIVLSLK